MPRWKEIDVLMTSQMQGNSADEGLAARFQSPKSILAPREMRDVSGPRVEKA